MSEDVGEPNFEDTQEEPEGTVTPFTNKLQPASGLSVAKRSMQSAKSRKAEGEDSAEEPTNCLFYH